LTAGRVIAIVTLDSERRKSKFNQGVRALYRGDMKEAERQFRMASSAAMVAIVALHTRAWERAVTKALQFLDFYDKLAPDSEDRKSGDEALMLRTLSIGVERLQEESVHGAAQQRRETVVKRARKRLESVEWEPVLRQVRTYVRRAPEIFGPLVTTRLGRRLVREGFATAADILLEGEYHQALSVVSRLNQMETGGKEELMTPICPHCFEQVSDWQPVEAREFFLGMRTYSGTFQTKCGERAKDLEHALVHGIEALFMAEYLGRGGIQVEDLLTLSDSFLRSASELAPSGEMKKKNEGLLSAFVSYHRARVAEMKRVFEDAVPLLEDVLSKAIEPWSERAEEALVRVRSIRDAEARRRAVAGLRSRGETAKMAGDSSEEQVALTELLKIETDIALLERLARLELEAKTPGWTERVKEAVKQGSRDATLLLALAKQAARIAPEQPNEAVALFRLAARGVQLSPEDSTVFATALLATGRPAEAGKVYAELGAIDPSRYLDAARAFAACGDERHAMSAVGALLDSGMSLKQLREGYDLAASLAPPDAMRPLAEKLLTKDAEHKGAQSLLDRLKARDFQALMETAALSRSEGLSAFVRRNWSNAAERLSAVPEEFRDEETRRALAGAFEELGRTEEALRLYETLQPSRQVLEGLARCQARLRRFVDARESVKALLGIMDAEEMPTLGGNPDLHGLLAEARGDLGGAAGLFEDEGLLHSISEAARKRSDAIAEYEALSRLANRYPTRTSEVRGRLAVLDPAVPVRVKGRHRSDLPILVLCDTNVLVANLMEDPLMPRELDDLRNPSAAKRLQDMRSSKDVRIAVTRTVAREFVALLSYRYAVEQNEEVADALRTLLERADAITESLDVRKVAGVVPRVGDADVERVRGFYRQFRARLRIITERKVQRKPQSSAAIVRKRTRGVSKATALPETADLRLLAEAAWLVDASVAGIGGIGIVSEDADFRHFKDEIEKTFKVRVC
jgi:tetratricopeptide (TPR) repeat protein